MKTGPQSRTYDELHAEISARHSELGRRLQQVAEYALENPNDMAPEAVAAMLGLCEMWAGKKNWNPHFQRVPIAPIDD